MRVAYLIIAMYLLLPYAGLYTISERILDVYNLSMNSVYELRRIYPIYLFCFTIPFLLPLYFRIRSGGRNALQRLSDRQLRNMRRNITFFLMFAALMVFLLAGQKIMSGAAHRGEIRISFGGLGFLYKTLVQFWVPAALAVSGLLYRKAKNTGQAYAFPSLHLGLVVLTLSMMGYKSGIVVGLLPFLFIIVSLLSFKRQIMLVGVILLLLIFYSFILMNGPDLLTVAHYLFVRGTEGTAWGLIASWDLFETPHPKSWLSLISVFGPRITAALVGIPPGSVEYLMLGSGSYVTYLVHPEPSVVLAGETNLTITLAGEGVYLMGRSMFWLIAPPIGFVAGLLYTALHNSILREKLLLAPLLAVAVTNILLPVLNSGGVIAFFSAFSMYYILATMIFIRLLYMTAGRSKVHAKN